MRQEKRKERGVTLLELLIVAAIMLMIMVVSVPVIKPMLQSQATSNAASVVSTYLNRARTRAILTGRPCGVTFEIWEGSEDYYNINTDYGKPFSVNDNGINRFLTYGASLVMRQVAVPPVYSGLTSNATVMIDSATGAIWPSYTITSTPPATYFFDEYWNTIMAGEQNAKIQFNNMGPWYPIKNNCIDATPDTLLKLGSSLPYPSVTTGGMTGYPVSFTSAYDLRDQFKTFPFKVLRDPRPTMTSPVGLPQGTVVDFQFSGLNNTYMQTNLNTTNKGVTIMFAPDGSVDNVVGLYDASVTWANAGAITGTTITPTETIFLLVGRWDRIAALGETEDGITNLNDANNFWVTINPRTGIVSTNEVNAVIQASNLTDAIAQSREFARQSKRNLGGQ